MTQLDATRIHDFIVDYFSLDELKTLCFKLGIKFDNLGGDALDGKARELVLLMERQTQLKRLEKMLVRVRPEAYQQRFGYFIHEKTGIELIRIPAGPFLYGSADSDEVAIDDVKPQRMVNLREYWISRYPVTNAQYKRFLDANPDHSVPFVDDYYSKPYNWNEMQRSYPADKAEHPVVLVTWFGAKAFCDWAGLWLPSEEQWEKAARGSDGRIWPWNNELPTADHCNFNRNVGGTTPVGTYSPKADSPYGCADMAGNVWEWTDSRRDNSERWRMLRGGSWGEASENCRCARRIWYPPDYPFLHFGFRVLDSSS